MGYMKLRVHDKLHALDLDMEKELGDQGTVCALRVKAWTGSGLNG